MVGRELVITDRRTACILPFEAPAPRANEVMLRTLVSGVSHGTELKLYCGTAPGFHRKWIESERLYDGRARGKRYPVRPGYECVAQVIELGADVVELQRGDVVWIDRPHRDLHVVEAQEAARGLLPPGTAPERGVFFALARVALGAVHDAQLALGDDVVVVGLGTIGLLVVQLARLAGARRVIAIDLYAERVTVATSLGALGVCVENTDVAMIVRELTMRPGVDCAIDCSGSDEGLQSAIRCCGVGGRVVAVSSYAGGASAVRLGEEFQRNRLTLTASMTVNDCPHPRAPLWSKDRLDATARELLTTGRLDIGPLITQRVPFERGAEVYEIIEAAPQRAIKAVLEYAPIGGPA